MGRRTGDECETALADGEAVDSLEDNRVCLEEKVKDGICQGEIDAGEQDNRLGVDHSDRACQDSRHQISQTGRGQVGIVRRDAMRLIVLSQ